MGGKRHNIKEKIIIYLKTNSIPEITIGKLRNNIKKDYFPDLTNKNYDAAFFRDFNKLLDSKIIEIVRYDSDKGRNPIQRFNFDPICIKYSKRVTRPDIKALLNKMNDDNKAYEKIRNYFKDKLEEFERFENVKMDYLKNRTFNLSIDEIWELVSRNETLKEIYNIFKDLTDEEKEKLLKYNNDCYEFLSNNDDYYNLTLKFDKEGTLEICDRCAVGSLFSLMSKYEDDKKVKIWFFPLSPELYNNIMYGYPMKTEDLFKLYSYKKTLDDGNYSNLANFNMIDVNGSWGIIHAIVKNGYKLLFDPSTNLDNAFELTIDIISTYPEDQKIAIIEILGKALSDEPGSLQLFIEFYRNIEVVRYQDRLLKIFDVFSKEVDIEPIERLANALEEFNEREKFSSGSNRGFI